MSRTTSVLCIALGRRSEEEQGGGSRRQTWGQGKGKLGLDSKIFCSTHTFPTCEQIPAPSTLVESRAQRVSAQTRVNPPFFGNVPCVIDCNPTDSLSEWSYRETYHASCVGCC